MRNLLYVYLLFIIISRMKALLVLNKRPTKVHVLWMPVLKLYLLTGIVDSAHSPDMYIIINM